MDDSEPNLIRRIWRRLGLRDLSTLSAVSRSRERYKRAGLTAFASMAARALKILTSLIAVPLTLHYLGSEQYGLWVTVSSIVALLSFTDMGLGLGLLQGISEAHGTGDREHARRYVSSTFFMLAAVSCLITVAFVLIYPLVPWGEVLNVESPDAASLAGHTAAVLVALFVLGLPLGIVEKVQMGYQEGFRNSIWDVVGAVISLVAVIMAIVAQAPLPLLALALAGGPLIGYSLNSAALLRRRPWLLPRPKLATRSTILLVAKLGFLFFVIQIGLLISFQTDTIVVARIMGVSTVTQFAIPLRLFFVVPILVMLGMTALWPALREATMRKDYTFVKKTYARSLAFAGGGSALLSAFLVIFGRQIVHMWVGDSVTPSTSLLLGFGAWAVVYVVVAVNSTLLNGVNAIGFEAILVLGSALANLVLSIILTRAIGISGPAWASVISLSLFMVLPSSIFLYRLIKRWDSFEADSQSEG